MAKAKSKRKNRRKWTSIDGHQRQRGQLLPPVNQLGDKLQFTSWTNERLPEMIWAGLISTSLGRERALHCFREIVRFVHDHQQREEMHDLSISGIAKLDQPLRETFLDFMAALPMVGNALATMLWFNNLPARSSWQARLPHAEPDTRLLMVTVAEMLHHQSEMSTDCRWLRVMGLLAGGKLSFAPDLKYVAEELITYPANYDKVQGTVRSTEGAICQPPETTNDQLWPDMFWAESWEKTDCITFQQDEDNIATRENLTRGHIRSVTESLKNHWGRTHSTTKVDAKHDAVFGMAFYCLRILNEIIGIGISTSVLGRLGLRTILETRVNLAYLLKQNDEQLWEKWRRHGAGQAKLNVLKFQDSVDQPDFINLEALEAIASEDIWQEFLPINLASWNSSDLRRTSEKAGIKATYDQYYPWASSYSHAMWGAIRESCYQTCINPLHRLHRYAQSQRLEDCLYDAAILVDEVLEQLDENYPTFKNRLLESNE